MKPDTWIAIVLGISALFVLLAGMRSSHKQRKQAVVAEEALTDNQPRCICGEVATEPMPVLHRSRGQWDWLRRYFASPPMYNRTVDDSWGPKVLCRVHAHVADAKMDEFIYGKVRSILASANAQIATEAAAFEKETLLKSLSDSLTIKERAVVRKTTNGVNAGTVVMPLTTTPSNGSAESVQN